MNRAPLLLILPGILLLAALWFFVDRSRETPPAGDGPTAETDADAAPRGAAEEQRAAPERPAADFGWTPARRDEAPPKADFTLPALARLTPAQWAERGEARGLSVAPTRLFIRNPVPMAVDFALLEAARVKATDRLLLDLGGEEPVAARVTRVADRGRASFTLQGKLEGEAGSEFSVTVYEDAAAGTFFSESLGRRELAYVGEGVHKVQELIPELMPPCGTGETEEVALAGPDVPAEPSEAQDAFDEPDGGGEAGAPPHPSEGDASHSLLDVMVVYTEEARIARGGTNAIIALIHQGVDNANLSYQNSQVNATLRLVHTVEVDYAQSSGSTALTQLRSTSDGHIDHIHALRDAHGADYVSLWLNITTACGVGYRKTTPSLAFASWAFTVVDPDCVANHTFAHEIGHNLGCHHAVGDSGLERGGSVIYPYAYGWRWTGSNGITYRSVMAYSPGSRRMHFSSPNVFFQGAATGTPDDDNARVIEQIRIYGEQYREAVVDDHGDTIASATTVVLNTVTPGVLETLGDIDMFRFVLETQAEVAVFTSGSTDTIGRILDGTGTPMQSDNDSGAGTNFRMEANLPGGIYYAEVAGNGGATGAYGLHVEAAIVDDHGNDITTATPAAAPGSVEGVLEVGGDLDFFRIEIAEEGLLVASTESSIDTFGELRDAQGGLLQSDDDSGPGLNFSIVRVVGPGTYYVVVRGWNAQVTGPYTLHLDLQDPNDDHSNTFAGATPLPVGTWDAPASIGGVIDYSGDIDMFVFTVAPQSGDEGGPADGPAADGVPVGTVRIRSTGSTDTYAFLLTPEDTVIAYDDDGGTGLNFLIQAPLAPGTYYLEVAGFGLGAYAIEAGFEYLPEAPQELTASDASDPHRVHLAWEAVGSADSYRIFRSTVPVWGGAVQIASGVAGEAFEDAAPEPLETYHYWVAAVNQAGAGPAAGPVEGRRGLPPPHPVTASPGTFPDFVRVGWESVGTGATYRVFRGVDDSFAAATLLGETAAPPFDDGEAERGISYRYWVRSVKGGVVSAESVPAQGFLVVPPPTGVAASNSTHSDRIEIQWQDMPEAAFYRVFRNTTTSTAQAQQIGTPAAPPFADPAASTVAGTLYHYWVKAVVNGTDSAFSVLASGRRAVAPATSPTAEVDYSEVGLKVEWTASPDASAYRVFRHIAPDFSGAAQVAQTSQLSWTDQNAAQGADYYYWIVAQNASGPSEPSEAVLGRRLLLARQPDLMVGGRANQTAGSGVYEVLTGQVASRTVTRRRVIRGFFRLRNDGEPPDSFRIFATRGDRFLRVTYAFTSPRSENITAASTSGLYFTPEIEPGQTEFGSITVRPSPQLRRSKRPRSASLTLWAFSTSHSARHDRAMFRAISRP